MIMAKKKKPPLWIRMLRAARRQTEIDLDIPKETSKIWKTSKKDMAERLRNSIRKEDIE